MQKEAVSLFIHHDRARRLASFLPLLHFGFESGQCFEQHGQSSISGIFALFEAFFAFELSLFLAFCFFLAFFDRSAFLSDLLPLFFEGFLCFLPILIGTSR